MALKSVKQFAQTNPVWSEASLRWLIFKAEENGLAEAGAILRFNGRVVIDEDRFIAHIRAQSTTKQKLPA